MAQVPSAAIPRFGPTDFVSRGTESSQTLHWREVDSNPWSPRKRERFSRQRRLAFHARGLTMSAISGVIAANILVASFL
jgi:hypothetical protein